jgi:hypothetical protein
LISADGEDEFTVLCASTGRVTEEEKDWLGRIPDVKD